MGSPTPHIVGAKIPDDKLKENFETYFGTDISNALFEKIKEIVDEFIDSDAVIACPHCEKMFLESENALEYEQSNGDYTCDCLSPENQAADVADMQIDFEREE